MPQVFGRSTLHAGLRSHAFWRIQFQETRQADLIRRVLRAAWQTIKSVHISFAFIVVVFVLSFSLVLPMIFVSHFSLFFVVLSMFIVPERLSSCFAFGSSHAARRSGQAGQRRGHLLPLVWYYYPFCLFFQTKTTPFISPLQWGYFILWQVGQRRLRRILFGIRGRIGQPDASPARFTPVTRSATRVYRDGCRQRQKWSNRINCKSKSICIAHDRKMEQVCPTAEWIE